MAERLAAVGDKTRSSQAWTSIFRPGSIYRKGYTDSPRNRSYVIMNNVLYHLHPVKVKRHAVKVSYTLCLGGLSFFLFILLTISGLPPDLTNLPPGCKFHPRCRFTVDRCFTEEPDLFTVGPQHESRCWVQMKNVADPDADLRETPLVTEGETADATPA